MRPRNPGTASGPARPSAHWAGAGILAAISFAAASFGLSLAGTHRNVSLVWPPTGIALAALLLFGYRLWPGVALGAFLINAATGVSVATAGGIAVGNTVEALGGAYLRRRVAQFRNSLERLQDVVQRRRQPLPRQLCEGFKNVRVPHRGELLEPLMFPLGVATFPEHGPTAQAILLAADSALYAAKQEGRDRVHVAS